MAKPAKQVEVEIAKKAAVKFKGEVLQCFDRIDSERAKFARYAKGERDRMTTIYEGMAAQGVPQKAAKINIKIIRALQKIQTWMAELEGDERKLALKLAQAQDDKQQLSLWDDLPSEKPAKKKRAKPPKQTDFDEEWAKAETVGQA